MLDYRNRVVMVMCSAAYKEYKLPTQGPAFSPNLETQLPTLMSREGRLPRGGLHGYTPRMIDFGHVKTAGASPN